MAIDPTGRHLLYAPHDTSGPPLVLRDLETGSDEIVSTQLATAGTDAVSSGGRDVVFHSTSSIPRPTTSCRETPTASRTSSCAASTERARTTVARAGFGAVGFAVTPLE
ncbi:hypothetical protein [Streptomyces scabiei]|uniref:hypothetical protein n=1 Tax=Streptomyces scabiei TaxID=1930 RepID=UPI0029901FB7|nr:hypothetical protein [Streptomyces scabiei]